MNLIPRWPGLFLKRSADACPSVACEQTCGEDDCTCPPCACPRCLARFDRARRRLMATTDGGPAHEQLTLTDSEAA